MRLRVDSAKVTVGGTVTNFGSGFRSIALAVDAGDSVTVRAIAGPTRLTLTGEATDDPSIKGVPADQHPTVSALRSLLDQVGAPQVGLHLKYSGRIPAEVGLGSHAAQVLAGLRIGRALLGNPEELTDDFLQSTAIDLGADRLRLAALTDGPLVVSVPALEELQSQRPGNAFAPGEPLDWLKSGDQGGQTSRTTSSKITEEPAPVFRSHLSAPISPVAFVPSIRIASPGGQRLPRVTDFTQAACSSARAGILLAALAGGFPADADKEAVARQLMVGTFDELRKKDTADRLPASSALTDWLRDLGVPAFISGSGPAVVSLLPVEREIVEAAARSGWRHLDLGVGTGVVGAGQATDEQG